MSSKFADRICIKELYRNRQGDSQTGTETGDMKTGDRQGNGRQGHIEMGERETERRDHRIIILWT